ncbi:hypothetical protein HanHA89_Chr01g0028641 [Helianthus annuus]|nr:hypothetical protein HanHA89_Chr01g0028641 [Helianthus annuus]
MCKFMAKKLPPTFLKWISRSHLLAHRSFLKLMGGDDWGSSSCCFSHFKCVNSSLHFNGYRVRFDASMKSVELQCVNDSDLGGEN